MADVQQVCDLVAVLRGGRVVFRGSLGDLVGDDPTSAAAGDLEEALEPLYAGADK